MKVVAVDPGLHSGMAIYSDQRLVLHRQLSASSPRDLRRLMGGLTWEWWLGSGEEVHAVIEDPSFGAKNKADATLQLVKGMWAYVLLGLCQQVRWVVPMTWREYYNGKEASYVSRVAPALLRQVEDRALRDLSHGGGPIDAVAAILIGGWYARALR